MIAKSDLVILVVSAAALTAGIYRWQQNTSVVPAVTVQANSRAPLNATSAPEVMATSARTSNTLPGATSPTVRRLPARTDDNAQNPIQPGATTESTVVTPRPVVAETIVAGTDTTVTATSSDPLFGTYTVKSGDYLGRIAGRFGTTVNELQTLNGIRGTNILVGQQLKYPLPAN